MNRARGYDQDDPLTFLTSFGDEIRELRSMSMCPEWTETATPLAIADMIEYEGDLVGGAHNQNGTY